MKINRQVYILAAVIVVIAVSIVLFKNRSLKGRLTAGTSVENAHDNHDHDDNSDHDEGLEHIEHEHNELAALVITMGSLEEVVTVNRYD